MRAEIEEAALKRIPQVESAVRGTPSVLSPLFPLSPSGSLSRWDSQRCPCWDEGLCLCWEWLSVQGLTAAAFPDELSTKNVIHGGRWAL